MLMVEPLRLLRTYKTIKQNKKELNNKLKNNKSNSIANKKWINIFTEFKQIEKLNSKIIYELIDNIYRRKWWN